MEQPINVKGNNPIDLKQRVEAINVVNGLTTHQLKNLVSLADSEKAKAYLSDDKKMSKLKFFL